MDIKAFFDLPEDQRQMIIELHNKQKSIRHAKSTIAEERRKLDTRETNNQMQCDHPFATKKYRANENEFGNLTGGGVYSYHCEDCGFRWQDDQ